MLIRARYSTEGLTFQVGQRCRFCGKEGIQRQAAALLTLEATIQTAVRGERAHLCTSHVRAIRRNYPGGILKLCLPNH